MKFLLRKVVKHPLTLLLLLAGALLSSCKKETREIIVDPFSKLDTEVTFKDGIYQIFFSLETYPYSGYRLRLSTDRNAFYRNANLIIYHAYPINTDRYCSYINLLESGKTYYYQIAVEDTESDKEIYSDVFSFKTSH